MQTVFSERKGARMVPSLTSFRAPSECRDFRLRDDVSHDYTCFIRRGEDGCLRGGFLSVYNGFVSPIDFILCVCKDIHDFGAYGFRFAVNHIGMLTTAG